MSTLELALPAAQRALAQAGCEAAQLDLIIACTVTPDHFTPSLACELQAKLGAVNAFAFDISAACSGFVYATDVADCYLRCGKAKHILVVCAETLSRLIDYTDRTTCCLFGDGAGAAVYTWDDAYEGVIATYQRADGASGDALMAQALPTENPFDTKRVSAEYLRFLRMNGSAVFRFTSRAVPDAIDHVLARAGLDIADIDWIVPHQANVRMIDSVIRRYGLDADKVYVNLPYVGNTSSASIPICLDEMRQKGLLYRGQRVIIVGFGGGLTYGAVLMRV